MENHFANIGLYRKVQMWELDHKEAWVLKNWCFWTVVLEKTLESCLDCKEIKPVNHKGNQLWIFIGRTDAEAEVPSLWPPDVKNWLTGKDPHAVKEWRQEKKWMREDEMLGWHHQFNGHKFEQTPRDSKRQERLACSSPWGHRVGHDWATKKQQQPPPSTMFFVTPHSVQLCSVAQLYPTLWPHGLQHARLPCPSPTPEVYSNSYPLKSSPTPQFKSINSSVLSFLYSQTHIYSMTTGKTIALTR